MLCCRKCVEVCGDFVEKLKIIVVGIFLFYLIKIYFPFIFYLSGGKTYQPALVLCCFILFYFLFLLGLSKHK